MGSEIPAGAARIRQATPGPRYKDTRKTAGYKVPTVFVRGIRLELTRRN